MYNIYVFVMDIQNLKMLNGFLGTEELRNVTDVIPTFFKLNSQPDILSTFFNDMGG